MTAISAACFLTAAYLLLQITVIRTADLIYTLIFWGISTLLLILIALADSLVQTLSIRRQIRSQDSGIDFNDEHFTECAKGLYIGRDWLVYHSGLNYRLYNHAYVKRVLTEDRRRVSYVRILCSRGTEGFKVKKTEGLQKTLQDWVTQPDW